MSRCCTSGPRWRWALCERAEDERHDVVRVDQGGGGLSVNVPETSVMVLNEWTKAGGGLPVNVPKASNMMLYEWARLVVGSL